MVTNRHPEKAPEEREAKEIALSSLIGAEKELGFLILGVVFGAALGILGNLWVAFLVELVRILIPPELWTVASFLGLIITTILSFFVLKKSLESAVKYIAGEERLAEIAEKKEA